MNFQERIQALLAVYADRASLLERGLFTEVVLSCQPHATANPGGNETYLVVFASRAEAIFKPFEGQNPATCANYQQDPYEVVLHEVAAWRLAEAMGGPWDQLLPTAVFRNIGAIGAGAVINKRRGIPVALPTVLEQAQAQADAAALWDALVGQQDRHTSNFRYEAETRTLALIDHGYAFALPGHRCNASVFVAERAAANRRALHPHETQALQQLLASPDLHGLRRFLDAPRVNALQTRAESMLARQEIPPLGAY